MPSPSSSERKRKIEDYENVERKSKRRRKEKRERRRGQPDSENSQAVSGSAAPVQAQSFQQVQAKQAQDAAAITEADAPGKSNKRRKREQKLARRSQKDSLEESAHAQSAASSEGSRPRNQDGAATSLSNEEGTLVKAGRKKRSRHRKSKVDLSKKPRPASKSNRPDLIFSDPLWTLSEPVGSHVIEAPPRLSNDEQYLICATESSITSYSPSDATPLHSLHRDVLTDVFTGFDLPSTSRDYVWAATRKGRLTKWNYRTGDVTVKRRVHANVQILRAVDTYNGDETIFLLKSNDSNKWSIARYDPVKDEEHELLKHAAPIRAFEVCDGGRIIVAITMSGLVVGAAMSKDAHTAGHSSAGGDYIWNDITCSEPPMCMDVNTSRKNRASARKDSGASQRHGEQVTIDIVLGGLRGSIFVFYDVLARIGMQQDAGFTTQPRDQSREQQLHWHREAVGSVTWSLDGQYIVSGGRETVLVLWQLETGRKQFLPNLESPIQYISVSPNGASYLIRLADNSVMILSAAELTPTAHVAGIQSTSFSRAIRPTPHLPTVDLLSQFGAEQSSNLAAAAINPRSTDCLLLSVPAHQAGFSVGGPLSPSPYLQEFDVATGRFVYRQALARTNAINVNLGPEGNGILEPNVKHLEVSPDGRWLATVDEWEMPMQDLKNLTLESDASSSTVRESKLRFWLWDETEKCWGLNSRIDEPHRFEGQPGCLSCLALAVDPSLLRFATLGADSIIKIWAPKSKLKNGKIVWGEVSPDAKGNSRVIETWWAVQSTISLEQSVAFDSFQIIRPDRAVLKYSTDGSILAAYQHYDSYDPLEPVVHFLDTSGGTLYDSRTGLAPDSDDIIDLAFFQQRLLVLSRESVSIWDITSFDLVASIVFPVPKDEKHTAIHEAVPHLAVNLPSKTFAVALPEYSSFNRSVAQHPLMQYRTSLAIYSMEDALKQADPKPVFLAQLPRTTMALLSASGIVSTSTSEEKKGALSAIGLAKGYVVLDLGAEVRRIMMTGVSSRLYEGDATAPAASSTALALTDSIDLETSAMELEPSSPASPVWRPEPPREEAGGDAYTVPESPQPAPAQAPQAPLELPDLSGFLSRDEDTRPVVRREQLAEVFDYPTMGMPPMIDLFNGVMGLYAVKPEQYGEHEEEGDSEDDDMDEDERKREQRGKGLPQVDGSAEVVEGRRDITGMEVESEEESSSSSDGEDSS